MSLRTELFHYFAYFPKGR